MQEKDVQLGKPFQEFANTKANIEALTGLTEGCIAYATDTNELGTYDGVTWTWGGTGGLTNIDYSNMFLLMGG